MSTDPADDIARLAEGLQSPDFAVRLATVQALGESGRPEAIAYLTRFWTSSRQGTTEDLQIEQLANAAFDALFSICVSERSPNFERTKLRTVLLNLSINDEARFFEFVDRILHDGDDIERRYAISAIIVLSIAPQGIPLFLALIKRRYGDTDFIDYDNERRYTEYLTSIGKHAVPALLEEIYNPNVWIRLLVLKSLGLIGDERALMPLINACSDESNWVRGRAAQALGRLGDARAVPHLIPRLVDTEAMFQSTEIPDLDNLAAEALLRIGTPEALEAVQQWQASRDNDE